MALIYLITRFIAVFSPTMTGIVFTTPFSTFCTVPKHIRNEMLGSFIYLKFYWKILYFITYTQKTFITKCLDNE